MTTTNKTLKPRRQIYNVFSKSILRRCISVVSALGRTSNVDYSWWYGSLAFPSFCLRVVKKINNDMAFLWYARLILWHQIQFMVPLSNSKCPKNCFGRLSKMSNAKLESYSLKLYKKYYPALDFPRYCNTNTNATKIFFKKDLFKLDN